jgi:hypothetical protein
MQSADVTETHEEKEDVEEVKCGWNERSCSWAHSDVFVSSQSSTGWDQRLIRRVGFPRVASWNVRSKAMQG